MTFSIPSRLILFTSALLLTAFVSFTDCRAGQADATLSSANGQVVLQVVLPKPPPVNLIAQMKLPSQTSIVSTSPQAAKIDKKKSVVKWLIKSPRAGTLRFSVQTSPPAHASSVSAVVTYRNPADGGLVKVKAGQK